MYQTWHDGHDGQRGALQTLYWVISSLTKSLWFDGKLNVSITEFLMNLVVYVFWAHRGGGHDEERGALQGYFLVHSVSSVSRLTKRGITVHTICFWYKDVTVMMDSVLPYGAISSLTASLRLRIVLNVGITVSNEIGDLRKLEHIGVTVGWTTRRSA